MPGCALLLEHVRFVCAVCALPLSVVVQLANVAVEEVKVVVWWRKQRHGGVRVVEEAEAWSKSGGGSRGMEE